LEKNLNKKESKMIKRGIYFLIGITFSLCIFNSSHAEVKHLRITIPDLKCAYGLKGITQKIKHYPWFKGLENTSKKGTHVTLKHGNTATLEVLDAALQEAAEKTKTTYQGIQRLTAWGTIKHGKCGYYLQISGSHDTIYLLENEGHRSSSFLRKAYTRVREWITNSDEKLHKKVEHLCAENCPVRLCATIHQHEDKTYGATKIIQLEAQE